MPLETYVKAFFTSTVFRVERKLLALALNKPSTADQARQLARGKIDTVSAWTVETRRHNEMLLRVHKSNIGTWFMVRPVQTDTEERTELLFGSVAISKENNKKMGIVFHSVLGFHKLYSQVLLRSATRRLGQLFPM